MKRKRRTPEAPSATPSPTLGDATPSLAASPGPPLYTARQVATHLNVSRTTVRRLTLNGVLPHVRIGGQIRYDILVVRAAIDCKR